MHIISAPTRMTKAKGSTQYNESLSRDSLPAESVRYVIPIPAPSSMICVKDVMTSVRSWQSMRNGLCRIVRPRFSAKKIISSVHCRKTVLSSQVEAMTSPVFFATSVISHQ